jgi:hypothetical protein
VSSRAAGIGFLGFVWRALFALALVLATYNPSQISYYHWLRGAIGAGTFDATHALVGIVLLVGWVVYLRATFQSMGVLGLLLGAGFFAALVWLLVDLGWLATDSVPTMTWIILVCLSLLLAIGMSWSHVRRRITGQVDVDDVEGGR